MRIRTVLDARPTAAPRYLGQTLLLAHSWAAWGGVSPLEVIVLGTLPPAVHGRLRDLGVELTPSRPHPLDALSRTANKLVALREPTDTPVLLVDNDVCFLEDVSDLQGRNVRASVANGARIADAQWDHVELTTGLRPLAIEWVSPTEELHARAEGRAPEANGRLYLNSGVVWVRQAAAFESIWAAGIDAIARAFDGHPLATRTLRRGSDQTSLATAVADHGGFDLFPIAYNYRHLCFGLGLSKQAKILHLQKLAKRVPVPFSKAIASFWDRKVIRWINLGSSGVGGAGATNEPERLIDEAMSVRDRLLRLVAEADLDAFDFRPDGT